MPWRAGGQKLMCIQHQNKYSTLTKTLLIVVLNNPWTSSLDGLVWVVNTGVGIALNSTALFTYVVAVL